jgi:hypothetical protein
VSDDKEHWTKRAFSGPGPAARHRHRGTSGLRTARAPFAASGRGGGTHRRMPTAIQ